MRYCDFPYFLYPGNIINEVKERFVLNEAEQELLGLEELCKIDLKLEGFDFLKSDDSIASLSGLSFLPYEFIKKYGVFNVLNMHNKLEEKLGEYRTFVIECIKNCPSELFNINSLSPEEHLELLRLMKKDDCYKKFVKIVDKIENNELLIGTIEFGTEEDGYHLSSSASRNLYFKSFSNYEDSLNRYFDLVEEDNKLYAVLNETGKLLYDFYKRCIEKKDV